MLTKDLGGIFCFLRRRLLLTDGTASASPTAVLSKLDVSYSRLVKAYEQIQGVKTCESFGMYSLVFRLKFPHHV